jgi:hypothetical protein
MRYERYPTLNQLPALPNAITLLNSGFHETQLADNPEVYADVCVFVQIFKAARV